MIAKKLNFKFKLFLLPFTLYSCLSSHEKIFEKDHLFTLINKDEKVVLFGHKNPDLDSYGSAYSYANLLKKKGFYAKAYSLGPANLETKYVLDFLDESPLEIITTTPKKSKIILLDHNEKNQSIAGLNTSNIIEIVDHHRLDLKTSDTINLRIERVGSTATIIYKKYLELGIKPDYKSSAFMLAAILSDTRVLTSPTTTDQDKLACLKLSQNTKIDYKKFGKDLLLAGTKTDHLSAKDLYISDLKTYDFSGQKASIGIISTIDIPRLLKRREEFIGFMEEYRRREKLNFCVLLLTDLLKNNSHAIVVGEKKLFNQAFGHKKVGKDYFLNSVVSRKRQVIPNLEEII